MTSMGNQTWVARMVAQWLLIMLQLPRSEEEEAAENKVVKFDNVVKFNNIGCRIQQRC